MLCIPALDLHFGHIFFGWKITLTFFCGFSWCFVGSNKCGLCVSFFLGGVGSNMCFLCYRFSWCDFLVVFVTCVLVCCSFLSRSPPWNPSPNPQWKVTSIEFSIALTQADPCIPGEVWETKIQWMWPGGLNNKAMARLNGWKSIWGPFVFLWNGWKIPFCWLVIPTCWLLIPTCWLLIPVYSNWVKPTELYGFLNSHRCFCWRMASLMSSWLVDLSGHQVDVQVSMET